MVSSRRTETPSRTLNPDMEAEKTAPPTAPAEAARLRIAGAWSGCLEVQLESWTLPMLRSEVAERSGRPSDCIILIFKGKVLRDDEGPALFLLELGLKNNSKVLATAVSLAGRKALNDEAAADAYRSEQLDRIWDAAYAFAESNADGRSLVSAEFYNMVIYDQIGPEVKCGSETDHGVFLTGLMLHTYAKILIKRQQYDDALDVLSVAEESFSSCDPEVTEMIANVRILELDTVWCYFMLRDISFLSQARIRLAEVRKRFGSYHCKGFTQFLPLHSEIRAELAIYMRLELLEGVVAYCSGNFKESRKALSSAQAKYAQLQVPDEDSSLAITGQDIQCAVDFQVEERAKKIHRSQEDIQGRDEIMEQNIYGKTAQNKAVDLKSLNKLVSNGFEGDLTAEALQLNKNDTQKALDDLTDPEKNFDLQHQLKLWKVEALGLTDVDIGKSMAIGYDGSAEDDALRLLSKTASRSNNQQAYTDPPTLDQEGPSGAAAVATDGRVDEQWYTADMEYGELDAAAMVHEIMRELTKDPLLYYDVGITIEGEAIAEYLALLDSTADESKGSR